MIIFSKLFFQRHAWAWPVQTQPMSTTDHPDPKPNASSRSPFFGGHSICFLVDGRVRHRGIGAHRRKESNSGARAVPKRVLVQFQSCSQAMLAPPTALPSLVISSISIVRHMSTAVTPSWSRREWSSVSSPYNDRVNGAGAGRESEKKCAAYSFGRI